LFLSSKAALADSPNTAATHWIEISNHVVSIAAANPLVRATSSHRLKIARATPKPLSMTVAAGLTPKFGS